MLKRVIRFALITGLLFVGSGVLVVAVKWPFTRRQEAELLEHFAQSKVIIGRFDKKIFPRPGFDAEQIVFIREADGKPVTLARVEHLECRSSWWYLLTYTHRVSRLNLSGVRIVIPERVPPAIPMFPNRKERSTVEYLSADGAFLEVRSMPFIFPRLRLWNVGKAKVLTYDVAARIPKPDSLVTSRGSIGPFLAGDKPATPLSGEFELQHGNLQSLGNLAGSLSAKGKFFGRLRQLNITGTALVQHFHLLTVHNPVDISAEFQTIADCKRGLVQLQKTTVRFAHSELESVGSVAEGVLRLNIESERAQVQDLLQLVVSSPEPPAAGKIQFHSEITLPPGREAFLRRIQMKGSFQIMGGEFRYPKSQFKMDELSVRASSRKKHLDLKQPPHVTAHVRTAYRAKEGTVTFPAITFDVPNASATATGTFNMLTKAIDLQGNLGMRATVSSAAGGIRSMLLLPLDPFYKKQGFGAVIPVSVEGTFGHPVFHASLRKHDGHRTEPRGDMSR